MSDRYKHHSYMIRKKFFKVFGDAFHIYDDQGQIVFYVKQKAFRLKEDIRIFSSEDMTNELLVIHARSMIDFSASYDVIDSSSGETIGALRRKGLKSMLQDEWTILDRQDREIGRIAEDSMALALIRRFLLNLIPQSFTGTIGQQTAFTFNQRFNPFIQKIELDFSMDRDGLLDRRLGIAASILISAVEGRQG